MRGVHTWLCRCVCVRAPSVSECACACACACVCVHMLYIRTTRTNSHSLMEFIFWFHRVVGFNIALRCLIDNDISDSALIDGCPPEARAFAQRLLLALQQARGHHQLPTADGTVCLQNDVPSDPDMTTLPMWGGFVGTSRESMKGLMDLRYGGRGDYCYSSTSARISGTNSHGA